MLLTGDDIEEICTVSKGSAIEHRERRWEGTRIDTQRICASSRNESDNMLSLDRDQNTAVHCRGKVENDLRADRYFNDLKTAP